MSGALLGFAGFLFIEPFIPIRQVRNNQLEGCKIMDIDQEEDIVSKLVLETIDAVQSRDETKIVDAYLNMAFLETGDVVSELFLWIDDLTVGIDDRKLLEACVLPVPPNSVEIIRAARNINLSQLQDAIGSDRLEQALSALFALVASLKEARARI